MAVLIDTSVLLAGVLIRDINHQIASDLLLRLQQEQCIVSAPVLSELFYMTTTRISYERAIRAFNLTRGAFQIESLTDFDMSRMEQIMTQYQDAKLDFVDVSIFALAERLDIRQICTFDRRDFAIFRPAHCDYFELLP
jgi:predicted nucleic acid-binding protein